MRKTLTTILAAAAVITTAGCGGNAPSDNKEIGITSISTTTSTISTDTQDTTMSSKTPSVSTGNDSNGDMTAEEFSDRIKEIFKAYSKGLSNMTTSYTEDKDITAGDAAVDECLEILKRFGEINAPEKYKKTYDTFLESVKTEERYMNISKDFYKYYLMESLTTEQEKEFSKLCDDYKETVESSEFPDLFLALYKELKADIG